jgi:hypothetical protein
MKTKNKFFAKGTSTLLLAGIASLVSNCDKDTSELKTENLSQAEGRTMATSSGNSLILQTTFEESDALSSTYWGREAAYSSSITRSTERSRNGNYSSKFVLNKSDATVSGSKRSELRRPSGTNPREERWYGFSVFLPSSFIKDPTPEGIFQFHEYPDFDLGETWRTPPIQMTTENGQWKFRSYWTTKAVNNGAGNFNQQNYNFGPYQTNAWTDWVIHVKYSYQSDGILEVWKNGTPVLRQLGPNSYNDKTPPYFKIGIYKWAWAGSSTSNTTQRTIYVDQLKIGNESSSYSEVAPGGSSATPSPSPTPSPAPGGSVVFAVNGGGGNYTASNGITYQSDRNYSGGFSHSVGSAVSNTTDDQLYQIGHYGTNFSYAIPLSDGTYNVNFNFVENYNSTAGRRQFDVLAEGNEIIDNLDIFKVAGRGSAYLMTKTVTVTDGTLNLNFRSDAGDAMVSAFHITKK